MPKVFKKFDIFYVLNFWILPALCLLPALYYQAITAINHNVVWNLMCAERLVNLTTPFYEACYDTNPPLSAIMYIPAYIFMKILPLPFYVSFFLFVILFMGVCLFWTYKMLLKFDFLSYTDHALFLITFAATLIIVVGSESFADREHFIAMILPAFVFCQICLTKRIKVESWLLYPILMVGAILLLVKPNLGIVPIMLLTHRLLVQKRLSILLDPDFIILSIGTIVYVFIVFFFFPDFVSIVLPDAVNLYLPNINPEKTSKYCIAYGISILLLTSVLLLKSKQNEKENFTLFLLFISLLCLLGFALQMKGFFYHLMPMLAFFLPSLSMTCSGFFLSFVSKKDFVYKEKLALTFLVLLVFALSYSVYPLFYQFPTHQDFIDSRLAKFIDKNCQKPCKLLMTNENMAIVDQTTYYGNITYASRFPSLWFVLPFIGDTRMPKDVYTHLDDIQKRFAGYMVEDLERYKPSLLMIINEAKLEDDVQDFDFLKFMSIDPRAGSVMKHYEKTSVFKENRGVYFKGTKFDYDYPLEWDVYKRKADDGVADKYSSPTPSK